MSNVVPVHCQRVSPAEWSGRVAALAAADARLLTLWGSDERDRGAGELLRAAFLEGGGIEVLELALATDAPGYPRIDAHFPSAARMQRAAWPGETGPSTGSPARQASMA